MGQYEDSVKQAKQITDNMISLAKADRECFFRHNNVIWKSDYPLIMFLKKSVNMPYFNQAYEISLVWAIKNGLIKEFDL